MNKEKRFNFKRILWLICTIELMIIFMSIGTDDKYIRNVLHMITIIPTLLFCICNNSNKILECVKNLMLYTIGLVAYLYRHIIGNIQYIVYIIATVVIIILAVHIEKIEGRKVTKKIAIKQFFRVIEVLILPITHGILNGINEYVALILPSAFNILNDINEYIAIVLSATVAYLYSKWFKKVFEDNEEKIEVV